MPIRRAISTVVLLTMAVTATLSLPAVAQEPPPDAVEITEAPALGWGFKASWTSYVGEPDVAGGAEVIGVRPGVYRIAWPFDGGSYDPEEAVTVVRYRGTVHWERYHGFGGLPPDVPALDMTWSDPIVTISRDRSTVSVEAVSRDRSDGTLVDYGRVALSDLDVSGTTPVVEDGRTTWPDIPAAAAEQVPEVFGGFYAVGAPVDPVGFSYTGPGGAPDLSEHFDPPGSLAVELARNELLTDALVADGGFPFEWEAWWLERDRQVVHIRYREDSTWTYQAFDLGQMRVVATLELDAAERVATPVLHDSTSGTLYYNRAGDTLPLGARWIRYDAEAGRYELGASEHGIPVEAGAPVAAQRLEWDPVGERAYTIYRSVPEGVAADAWDDHVWHLHTYAPRPDGSWEHRAHELPGFPSGFNRNGAYWPTPVSTVANTPRAVTAPDGSLIVLGNGLAGDTAAVPRPETVPGARRITFAPDGEAVQVQDIDGIDVTNSTTANGRFTALQRGPDGQVTLFGRASTSSAFVQTVHVGDDGVAAGPRIALAFDAGGQATTNAMARFAVDPADGTAWIGGYQDQRLIAVHDGQVVHDRTVPWYHPRGGPLVAGAGHSLHVVSSDGAPPGVGGSPIYGIARFERLGFTPSVTADPEPVSVSLGVGQGAEEVLFSSTATGDPDPGRQWQVKVPGSSRFTDVEGQTGETLTVQAAPGMGGSEYRAVYANAAGRVASEPATLAVDHAPIIAFQPVDAIAVEGNDAAFDVEASGAPEPEVTWQRYALGFWLTIDPDDGGVEVDGGRLVVTDVNLDQDGTRVRARLRNPAGTVHTRVATLSVAERAEGTRYVVDGALDWGVRASFRSYITGPIAQGAIDTGEGATVDEDGAFSFPAASGQVDGDRVDAAFDGVVHFTGHRDTDGVPALDMRISDLRVEVDGQDGTLVADVASRGLEDGELTTYDDVAFAALDLSAVSPTPVEGGVRYAGIPATLTDEGAPAFADFYPAGDPLDALTVTLVLSDDDPGGPGEPARTPIESFATAALTDLLGAAPTDEEVAAAVTQVEGTGKAAFLRTLTTSDPWLTAIVDDLYQDTLGRPADPAGAAFWVDRLRSGWSVAHVAAHFYASPEHYGGRGGGTDRTWVTDLYHQVLGRAPDPAGLDFWAAETARRGRGDVARRLYQSPESAQTRVRGLYQALLGRAADPGGLAHWAPIVVQRGDLVLAVHLAASPEYQQRAEARYP